MEVLSPHHVIDKASDDTDVVSSRIKSNCGRLIGD
jgi:hypothetical protein